MFYSLYLRNLRKNIKFSNFIIILHLNLYVYENKIITR